MVADNSIDEAFVKAEFVQNYTVVVCIICFTYNRTQN